jgi:hypothetical protein
VVPEKVHLTGSEQPRDNEVSVPLEFFFGRNAHHALPDRCTGAAR